MKTTTPNSESLSSAPVRRPVMSAHLPSQSIVAKAAAALNHLTLQFQTKKAGNLKKTGHA